MYMHPLRISLLDLIKCRQCPTSQYAAAFFVLLHIIVLSFRCSDGCIIDNDKKTTVAFCFDVGMLKVLV